ncbi:hypothetical protein MBCUR_03180 [Methanobrevibacter curvatus]|uniref:Uncharacterized protein n=2 Tax=Methanobrevibacter curvatus TaxID=49547 RepID=A0A166D0V3_9EURY|nr:hypothetical protein MBCUR_03180 [Methanobrevibacter curvatus]
MAKRYLYNSAPKPVKLTKDEKIKINAIVKEEIEKNEKLKKDVARINIKAGRVYFYFWDEIDEDRKYIVPIIDEKYIEYMYGRITIFDKELKNCTLDWQRHNNQWMQLGDGSLVSCINQMEKNSWFHT